jgi:hypothetical protein
VEYLLAFLLLAQSTLEPCPCDADYECECEKIYEEAIVEDPYWGDSWNIWSMDDNGDVELRFDVVFVGDGFTEEELPVYQEAVTLAIDAIESTGLFPPCAFNYYRVDVESDVSGVDHPYDGHCVPTPLQTGYGDPCDPANPDDNFPERCITTRQMGFAWDAAAKATGFVDIVFVLVNDTQWGACAAVNYNDGAQWGALLSAIGEDFEETIVHELAHIVGPLEDEYPCLSCDVCGHPPEEIPATTWPEDWGDPWWVANLTTQTDPAHIPWWDESTVSEAEIPTTESDLTGMSPQQKAQAVGLFEGGGWYSHGVYRPSLNCKMRCLGQPFCKICKEAIHSTMLASCPFDADLMIVDFDIKPTSCPNPLNLKVFDTPGEGGGVLPVAILGSEEFDVSDIAVPSVEINGISPLGSSIEDVATPVREAVCECTTEGSDGFPDLTLKFNKAFVAATLGDVADGEVVEVSITGRLLDGTPFRGTDCVVIRGR